MSYEIAKSLKELGFNEPCFSLYEDNHLCQFEDFSITNEDTWITNKTLYNSVNVKKDCSAPTYQQVVDWLREEKDIQINIVWNKFYPNNPYQYEVRPTWREQPVRPYGTGGMESTYYKSLERAIEEALRMIDNKEFKKGGDIENKKNKETMSDKNEIFEEIADYGDQMYFTRDFGHVIISEEDDKEIPLVLVAEISDYYEATGEDEFKDKPFVISIDIYPRIDFIDKEHIESCAQSAGIEPEEVGYTDLKSYGLGIPLLLKDFEEGFESMEEAEEFIKSDDLMKKLKSKSMLIGFFMDGAINRAGDSRWSYLEYALDKKKSFY